MKNSNQNPDENSGLSKTQQQKFDFDDLDEMDNTFLRNYKNIKKISSASNQKKVSNSNTKKQPKKRTNKYKKRKNYINVFIILVTIILIMGGFIVYHFTTVNHKKVEVVIKKITTVDDNYLFLGDSITEQYDLEKYYKDMPVVNSGISGNKTQDILNNLKHRVYDYNPSKIFMMIGTNDLNRINELEVDEIFDNIKDIVQKIKENRPQAKIYLESVLPVNHDVEKTTAGNRDDDRIVALNKKIEVYAKENKITYINLYDKVKDKTGRLKEEYTKDGLHLNNKGYEIITNIIKDYME